MSKEAFRVVVSALGGMEPALMTKNVNDLRLLCEEFGFAALRSKVSAFEMWALVCDGEARTGLRDVTESALQVTRPICLMDQSIMNLRAANSCQTARNQSQKQKIDEIRANVTPGFRGDPRRRGELGRRTRAHAGEL
jgi:hypothetical protein